MGELVRRGPCLPEGIEMYDGDPSQITDQRFSDDDEYIVAGALRGATCFWRNPGVGQKLISRAKGIVPRELTDAERKEFFLSERKDAGCGRRPLNGTAFAKSWKPGIGQEIADRTPCSSRWTTLR
jgi:hypothetical protein